jgi:uncharacterized protein (DUF58 family)
MWLLCYFLLTIFLVYLLASYINFACIDLQIGKCSEGFVGDDLHVPLWLNANSGDNSLVRTPVNGLLQFTFQAINHQSMKKTKTNYAQSITLVDANAFSNPINLRQKCQRRGKLTLSRVTIESFYPLRLYRCWTHLAFTHQITVFPKPRHCEIRLHVNEHNNAKESAETTR